MTSSWVVPQIVYTAFSFWAFLLAYIPLYWHLEAWNMGTVLWIFWAGTGCLIQFINGVIWRDNTANWAPVWCDIVTRFIHVQPIGVVVASALINRRLFKIVTMSKVSTSQADRRRSGYIDLSVGFGVPLLFMGLYWFVQGHRFNIIEGIGCIPTTPQTTVLLMTYSIWPVIILIISASYGVVSIRSFLDHRSDVALLSARSKSLTEYRYLRLMLFSSLDVLFLLPISFYLLYIQSEQLMYPWNGLADLHYGFSAVGQVPFEVWRSTRSRRSVVLALPCTSIAACFVFFAFFGLAKESRDHYYSAWRAVSKIFTRSTADQASQFSEGSAGGSPDRHQGTLPSFVKRVASSHRKRDSLSSTLPISVTIEGLTVHDDKNHLGMDMSPLRTPPPVPPKMDDSDSVIDISTAPAVPPGLTPPGSAQRPSFLRQVFGLPTPPPSHSFDAPNSVFTETMHSVA